MKKPKEQKKHVLERLMCCWGESCAVFFIISGELLAVALAVMLAYDYLEDFSRTNFPVWLAAGITALLAMVLWLAVACSHTEFGGTVYSKYGAMLFLQEVCSAAMLP